MSSNWLDFYNNSNAFQSTYIQGFIDISGGDIISRTGNIYAGADATINSRLFVAGDASFNNRLFAANDVSLNAKLAVNADAAMNSRLFLGGDASLNRNLNVAGDVSFNGRLFLNQQSIIANGSQYSLNVNYFNADVSMNNRLVVNRDVSLNNRLFVGSDLSVNGVAFIGSDLVVNGQLTVNKYANYNVINTTTTTTMYTFIFSDDISINGRLFVAGDVSFSGKLGVSSDISTNGFYVSANRFTPTYFKTGTVAGNVAIRNIASYVIQNESGVGVYMNTGTSSWSNLSDSRLKKNIFTISTVIDKINNLRPVTYQWNDQTGDESHVGFVAQEVLKEFPEVISETYSETLKDRVYGIKQTELIPILVRGMQEQQAQINDLKKRLDRLSFI
jgi:hypothetical protein